MTVRFGLAIEKFTSAAPSQAHIDAEVMPLLGAGGLMVSAAEGARR